MHDTVSDERTELNGLVEKITYSNSQNGYTVCTVKSGKEHITVVGVMPFWQ